MTDELGRELGAWLRKIDVRPTDPATDLRRAMANVEHTPQVSRSRLSAVFAHEPIPTEPFRNPSTHRRTERHGQDRPAHAITRGTSRMFITATATAVTTAFVLAGSLLLSGLVEGPTPPPVGASQTPSTESPSLLVGSVSAAEDTFELTITTPRTTWSVDEPIEVSATLTYIGEEPEVTVIGAGSGLVGFGIEQLDGPVDMEPGWRLSAREYHFAEGGSIEVPFTKSGVFDSDGPMGEFWRSWFDDPELRLPAGTYNLSAVARYRLPDAKTGLEIDLGAEIPIEVVDDVAGEALTEWGPLAVISEGGAPDAGLGPGTISIGADCVTLQGDPSRDDVGITLVWPSDQTEWLPSDRQIVFEHPVNGTIRLSDGDHVTFGGQALGGDSPEVAEQVAAWLEGHWVQRPDPSCPAGLWHVGEVLMVPRVELLNPDGTGRGGGGVVAAGENVVGERPDYAGAYLDRGRRALPVFLFTGDLDSAIEQLVGRLGDDVRFEVREVKRSLAELDAIQQVILDADQKLRRQGVEIVEVGKDVRRNQVVVGVLGKVDLASSLLSDYADARAFRVEKVGKPETA